MAAKSEQTRQRVAETALRMFREIGFEQTTMRAIAAEAGVAVGNAYYYFASKDELVQELYQQIQADHAARAAEALDGIHDLRDRLKATLHAGLDTMAPYHRFGAEFIATAIRPTSPTNPFNPASSDARKAAQQIFVDVVEGATPAPPRRLRSELPGLLWMAYMGVTLFWVYDTSEGQRRTRMLVDGIAPLVARGVSLARIPGVGKILDDAMGLARALRTD